MTTESSSTHSPHVLNLADQIASLEGEVAGSIEAVRGTVGTVLQESPSAPNAVALPADAQRLAEQRLAAADRPADAAPTFQPVTLRYGGAELHATTPRDLARGKSIEHRNERRLRSNPTRLLVNFAGKPDPSVTATRYAGAVEEHRGKDA